MTKRPWLYFERVNLLVVLILILLIGILFILLGLRVLGGLWGDALTQVGIALVTASILAGVVDRYLKERLILETEKRIFSILEEFRAESTDAFHLQKLPTELLDVVRRTIIESPVIERDLSVNYHMTPVQIGRASGLRAEITSVSIIENLTEQWQENDMLQGGVTVPKKFSRSTLQDAGFVSVEAVPLEGELEQPFRIDKGSIAGFVKIEEGQPVFRRPVRIGPKAKVRVTGTHVGYFELDDWDSFNVSVPTINMTMTISISGVSLGISGEPNDESLNRYWEGAVDEERGTAQWRISGALLPGQGITFEWQPLAEEEASN